MRKYFFIKSLLLLIMLFAGVFSFQSCTTYQIPDEVCVYGSMVCSTGDYICQNYELPPAVCTYFSAACQSLNVLCNSPYGSDEYKTAIKNLNDANLALNKYLLENQKTAKP